MKTSFDHRKSCHLKGDHKRHGQRLGLVDFNLLSSIGQKWHGKIVELNKKKVLKKLVSDLHGTSRTVWDKPVCNWWSWRRPRIARPGPRRRTRRGTGRGRAMVENLVNCRTVLQPAGPVLVEDLQNLQLIYHFDTLIENRLLSQCTKNFITPHYN